VLCPAAPAADLKPDAPGQAASRPVTLGLIQMRCDRGPAKNLDHAIELIGTAAKAGAQLVVLPELFCTPYFCQAGGKHGSPEAKAAEKAIAAAKEDFSVAIPGPVTKKLEKAAAANKVVLVGGSLFEKADDHYFNTSPVFDSNGKFLGVYRKTHIPHDEGFWEQHYFSHGDTGIKLFNTAVGKVAVQICYDQWFPEGARLAALEKAEFLIYPTAIGDVDLIKHPNEGNWREMWTVAQAGHAVCNHLFVAAANRVGQEGQTNFWGGSFVADPCGRVIHQGGVAEEVVVVRCERSLIEVMRKWRFLDERRPEHYVGLTKTSK
jgi:predicted amidohydrolase